jgi:tRNA modification GTPase
MMLAAEPIIAIATAPGRGAVGIVRVSGAQLQTLILAVCGQMLTPRVATLLNFLGADHEIIDRGLALYFPAPHSYTGEDVLELQAHGGPVVLQILLERCLHALPGARLARPGEFTERAFLNDKMDLAQAEAVSDLIDASTTTAARSAARSLQGAFSKEIQTLAEQILHLRMLVEATLDFPEEDIDFLQRADAQGQLNSLCAQLARVLLQTRQGVLLREGLRVVIVGQPNVGKSSLLNALAGQDVAIVTPIAGTTRDRIEQTLHLQGVPLHVVDTAGLRHTAQASDEVERIGIQRSWQAIAQADALLWVRDLARAEQVQVMADDAEIWQSIQTSYLAHAGAHCRVLELHNKCDADDGASARHLVPLAQNAQVLRLSAKTGEGLEALRAGLLQAVGWQALPEGVFIARTRHTQALERCRGHLARAQKCLLAACAPLDILAEELRLAHQALGEITGQVSADELLGEIFSSFCIGK